VISIICGTEKIDALEPERMELNYTFDTGDNIIDMKEFL
jgi:hypothetical protein